MQPFSFTALPARVVFGFGTLDLVAAEIERLGCGRALVLSTPQQESAAFDLADRLGPLAAGVHAHATMHTPVGVTERAVATAVALGADCVVALGGGSAIGLGKAIALRTDLPQVAVPTTYAGSEATPILGETASGQKTTQRTLKVLPETIVYDVDLTMTLPAALSAVSGINAIAHAVEALYAEEANPVTSSLAEQGVRALAGALPRIVRDAGDREARSDALFGAWACGTCLGTVGMALHHKLCHVLGGSFDLPHAETHAILLAHVVAYNAQAAPEAMRVVARAFGGVDAAQALYGFATSLGVPLALREIGMPEAGIDDVVERVLHATFWNPAPVARAALRNLLDNAFQGRSPATGRPERKVRI